MKKFLFMLLVLSGCASPPAIDRLRVPPPPERPKAQTFWKYHHEGVRPMDFTYEFSGLTDYEGTQVHHITCRESEFATTFLSVGPKGIEYLGSVGLKPDRSILQFPSDPTIGREWRGDHNWTGRGVSMTGQTTETRRIVRKELIRVPAGIFETYVIEIKTTSSGVIGTNPHHSSGISTIHFVPELGREVQSTSVGTLNGSPTPSTKNVLTEYAIGEDWKSLIAPLTAEAEAKKAVAEPEMKAGDEAAADGKHTIALKHYGKALAAMTSGTKAETAVREKVIRLTLGMNPPPAVPEEALRHRNKGEAFIKHAKGPEDITAAVAELEQASLAAPWWPDGYSNLALAREQAQDYDGAISSLRLFLLAAPASPDIETVKAKLDELEVLKVQAARSTR